MDPVTDAKSTCPLCASPTKKATASEKDAKGKDITYPVRLCTDCGWNG